jgi:spore maturation protein CgeB
MTRLLFIEESWLGSCGRSLREALSRQQGVLIDDIAEDRFFPKSRVRWLRAINRLFEGLYRNEFYRQIHIRMETFKPNAIVVYKGHSIHADFLKKLRGTGALVVNIYPDCSPHAHGTHHRYAIGAYDMVVSSKIFHPSIWKTTYGYENDCRFVPQGYDPQLHYYALPPANFKYDVVMVATWRSEYADLVRELANHWASEDMRVCIAGEGWKEEGRSFPSNWVFPGAIHGRSYPELLRSGRVCIAPVSRSINIEGQLQPGDEDSTRTYELAASYCFFIHRRTNAVSALYDEESEVPMYETPKELAEKVTYYLGRPEMRMRMADAAHKRAVPSYSLDSRAGEILELINTRLSKS